MLGLYSVQGFPLYEDTDLRRATANQLYCFAIEVGFGANEPHFLKRPDTVIVEFSEFE